MSFFFSVYFFLYALSNSHQMKSFGKVSSEIEKCVPVRLKSGHQWHLNAVNPLISVKCVWCDRCYFSVSDSHLVLSRVCWPVNHLKTFSMQHSRKKWLREGQGIQNSTIRTDMYKYSWNSITQTHLSWNST